MSIDAIGAVGAATQLLQSSAPPASVGSGFADMLDQIATLNSQMVANEAAVRSLALGDTDNLHEVMMGLESARLQLDLLLQVRNKLLDAYQELMRMQV
jgi:flagellar hook-basal body complex protein FliE